MINDDDDNCNDDDADDYECLWFNEANSFSQPLRHHIFPFRAIFSHIFLFLSCAVFSHAFFSIWFLKGCVNTTEGHRAFDCFPGENDALSQKLQYLWLPQNLCMNTTTSQKQ